MDAGCCRLLQLQKSKFGSCQLKLLGVFFFLLLKEIEREEKVQQR